MKISLKESRLIFDHEMMGDIEYSSTPQINVDEGPSDQFKDKWRDVKKAIAKAKGDEAKSKKDEAADVWVRLVIYLAFGYDIEEGKPDVIPIQQVLDSISPEQRKALDTYVLELQKLPEQISKVDKEKGASD